MRQKRRSRDRKIPNDPMPVIAEIKTTKRAINPDIVARSKVKPAIENAFVIPSFPPRALPPGVAKGKHPLAMDTTIIEVNAWASQNLYAGAFNNGATFLGYPYLSQLAQIPEYRKITETIAMHMTRKFITLQAAGEAGEGDESKTEKIKQITDDLENFGVRDVFRRAAEVDGYFGRAHLYIDLGYEEAKELKMPIGDGRNALSQMKVAKGSLKGFKIIEPVWTYPGSYNSNNPMSMDWYNPQTWFVMQKEIHVSRCLRMVGREVPDLLKPAYSFGGLSLSQMAKPYVDNWLRTRQSVADLIWSFSVSGVMTDLQTLMQQDGTALFDRAELFNNLRNNRGMMLLNKDSEEFFQVNTPLGTLDKLQAQAQEHMASVSSIPLVFLLGITPSGLNASSEGEIRAFYDFIHAFQTKFFTDPLKRVIDFIQLNRYGKVDEEITFIFEPLWSMTEKEQSEVDKTHAETDDLRINGGVISPLEARKRVANAPDTPYAGLDITVIPVPPGSADTDGDGEPDPDGAPPIGGEELDPGAPKDNKTPPVVGDEGWTESKHPRGQPGNAGQFGPGGSGSSGSKLSMATAKQIGAILNKTAGISGKYRQGIQTLLKDSTVSAETKKALKHKLVESYAAKAVQLQKKGDPKWKAVAHKAEKVAKTLGTVAPKAPDPMSPEELKKKHEESIFEAPKDKSTPEDIDKPTPEEIQKAMKATTMPNYSNSSAVVEFNKKWANKTPKDETEAAEKVKDYKEAKAKSEAEQKEKNEKEAAEYKTQQEKYAAEMKEKAKKEAAELAAEMNDPEIAKHYAALKGASIGLSKSDRESYNNKIKKAGLEGVINAVDAALINAYTGGHYHDVNRQLRNGSLTKEQFNYAKSLNNALMKLPKHVGTVKRGTDLSAEVFKKYKVGYIVNESAFTSSGKGYKFSGSHTYEIESTEGRDVQKLSGHPSENEVIFPAGSHFEVTSVTGTHIKMRQVENFHG